MKKSILILLAALTLAACLNQEETHYIGNWNETDLEFSKAISFQSSQSMLDIILEEKWCCGNKKEYYNWLRDSDNLLTTFNVLKKVGLKRLLNDNDYHGIIDEDDYYITEWTDSTLNDIVLNMIHTYDIETDTSDYFYKFWQRRKTEKNDTVVLEILKEIDLIYNSEIDPEIKENYLNDTLYNLIEYNVQVNKNTELKKTVIDYFNYLKETRLEHSAYNLIFEVEKTNNLPINRDSLLMTLSFDTIPEIEYWNTRNDAEWIRTYQDNGP